MLLLNSRLLLHYLGLHGEQFDSNAADRDTAEEAEQFKPRVVALLVEHEEPTEDPHYHKTGLIDGHCFKLVVVFHRTVDEVEL